MDALARSCRMCSALEVPVRGNMPTARFDFNNHVEVCHLRAVEDNVGMDASSDRHDARLKAQDPTLLRWVHNGEQEVSRHPVGVHWGDGSILFQLQP